MLDVFDLRTAAQPKIPPAHWGNLEGGSDDGRTVHRNSEMFEHLQIRARRLVDISKTDTSITLLGTKLASPLVLCPLSGQEAYHPDGEVATATAASKRGHLMAMSSLSSKPVADIAKAVGDSKRLWFQCYPTDQLSVTKSVIQRAEAAGAAAIILTADVPYRGNRTQMIRDSRNDKRPCESCHAVHPTKSGKRDWKLFLRQFPTYADLGLDDVKAFFRPITMDFVKELRTATKLPIVIKGIMTAEDAKLCVDNQIDAIWVSNHGGRQENSGMATIEALPEIATAVGGKLPIIFDGGVRRGTDIFKALALGATAVGIGRPQAWGLGAFGAAGVERALDILHAELITTMKIVGTPTISAITSAAVTPAASSR
jgi:isopentenyl diphosphate isomerase/L-lactate dehydrogenase-like FMN-dependent dehydrogenase